MLQLLSGLAIGVDGFGAYSRLLIRSPRPNYTFRMHLLLIS
jgi:hypothetical protein